MGIPLKKIMELQPFSRARLVAGANGLNRIVEAADIQEVPDVDRWIRGGEIVFSSGYAFKNEDGCALIEQLDGLGVAALAIKPSQYLPQIPRAMIERADMLDFPLFEMPEDLPHMDCILPILQRITEEQFWVLQRVEVLHEQLMAVILYGEGLARICDFLHLTTRNPVFLLSPDGAMLACCADELTPEELEEILAFQENYFSQQPIDQLRPNLHNTIRWGDGRVMICIPIVVKGEHIANLVLDRENEMIEMDMIVFEHASSLIALELLKERSLIQKEEEMRGQLLEDVIMRRYNDVDLILRRGQYLGFDLTRPYVLFAIDADAFEAYLRVIGERDEERVQRIKQSAQQIIRETLRAAMGPMLLMNNSVGMAGMAFLRGPDNLLQLQEVLQMTINRLKEAIPRLDFSIGISRVQNEVDGAVRGWQEAQIALRVGRKRRSGKRISLFEELGALRLLCELPDSDVVMDYYEEHMKKLLDYDAQNGAELVATLECYIRCNGNQHETASRLFVHRNTVVYRLKKVRELLGIDLTDFETLFNLQLCLKLREIR